MAPAPVARPLGQLALGQMRSDRRSLHRLGGRGGGPIRTSIGAAPLRAGVGVINSSDGRPSGIVNLDGRGMFVVSVAQRLRVGRSFARLLCCPL